MQHNQARIIRMSGVVALISLQLLCVTGSAQSAELTLQQRVDRSLVSPSAPWVEMQLKQIPEGTPKRDEIVVHLNELNKQAAERNKQAAIEAKKKEAADKVANAANAIVLRKAYAANAIVLRKAYAAKLRDKFLDDGMDIKVSPYGKSATQLYLKFALFNDVWVHKFQKGTLIDEIQQMGFKRVDFDDGYEYHKYFVFK